MVPEDIDRLQQRLLVHLLDHRGQQVRFEASQWTTEFGILRRFPEVDPTEIKSALRTLEMSRMVYRRTQYVVGFSEPKHVYTLTPVGHRKAIEVQQAGEGEGTTPTPPPPSARPSGREGSTGGPPPGSASPSS